MDEKKRFNTVLRIVIILIFIYYLITLFGIIKSKFTKTYIDFPCTAEVTSDGCLIVPKIDSKDIDRDVDFEVFITIFEAGAYGGGCEHIAVNKNIIRVMKYTFEKEENSDVLIINKKTKLQPLGTFERVKKKFSLNPWRIKEEFINIKNHGYVNSIMDMNSGQRIQYGPALVIIGNAGTSYTFNWHGIIILLVLILIFILTIVFAKKKKKEENAAVPEE